MPQPIESTPNKLIETPINPHYIAIENPENICFNCLQNHQQLHTIYIPALNHNSKFENFSSLLHLCSSCYNFTNPIWWQLEIIKSYTEYNMMQLNYKYEQEILDFINQMPLSGQELFYARFSKGINCGSMKGQDWIDYELDKLSHEKCNEYGYYSPEERNVYQERFHVCDKVRIVVYKDDENNEENNDKVSRCPFGAFGNDNGASEEDLMYHQCYECKMFKVRDSENEIEVMNEEDYEIYELENELALKILLREVKNENKEKEDI